MRGTPVALALATVTAVGVAAAAVPMFAAAETVCTRIVAAALAVGAGGRGEHRGQDDGQHGRSQAYSHRHEYARYQ